MEVKAAFDEACAALKGDRRRTYELFDGLFQRDQKALFMNPEKNLSEDEVLRLRLAVEKMARGMPMAYVLKQAYFYGEAFYVDERVLIPRYDTERSVESILRLAPRARHIVEIGTGSGCVAITLGRLYPRAIINASDISSDALYVAEINKKKHGASNVHLIQSDLFSSVEGTYDVIYSNPPYITADEMRELDESVALYEPHLALEGGEDGLDFYRKIVEDAPRFLNPGGWLVFEIGAKQRKDIEKLLKDHDFSAIGSEKDFSGLDRVVFGRLENV